MSKISNLLKTTVVGFISCVGEDMPVRIVRDEEVEDSMKKSLNKETKYKFECEIDGNKLSLRLIEIKSYSPYFFQEHYTLEDFQKNNAIFKSCSDLETVQNHLLKLFSLDTTKLKLIEDDKDEQKKYIILNLLAFNISGQVEVNFKLNLEMVSTKDKSLFFLYKIQKEKNSLLEKIKGICQENKGDNVSVKILQLLSEEDI